MNLTTPPPAKLSDLIELAISDARKLDRDAYIPKGSTWHRPDPNNERCAVCLAGIVIAGTLGCSKNTWVTEISESDDSAGDGADPQSTTVTITDPRWSGALMALDAAREGDWLIAFDSLYGRFPEHGIRDKVEGIAKPDMAAFTNWEQLETHLASLSACAEQLRELGI